MVIKLVDVMIFNSTDHSSILCERNLLTNRQTETVISMWFCYIISPQAFSKTIAGVSYLIGQSLFFPGNKVELPDSSGGAAIGSGKTKGWTSYLHRWTGY